MWNILWMRNLNTKLETCVNEYQNQCNSLWKYFTEFVSFALSHYYRRACKNEMSEVQQSNTLSMRLIRILRILSIFWLINSHELNAAQTSWRRDSHMNNQLFNAAFITSIQIDWVSENRTTPGLHMKISDHQIFMVTQFRCVRPFGHFSITM